MKQQQQQQEGLKAKEKLQAVVIAETFDNRFATVGLAPALLPVGGGGPLTLLDHALELLAAGGVHEAVVACGGGAAGAAVAAHVHASARWRGGQPLAVSVVESPDSVCAGDLLRDVYGRQLLAGGGDVVVVFADVVSNADVAAALREHRARRDRDKGAVLTLVYARAPPRHPARSREDAAVLALDAQTAQILAYDARGPPRVAREALQRRAVDVRGDLLEPGVAVCAPEVLQQLQDNFDYRTLAPDLVRGLLDHADILGYRAFAHVLPPDRYAACARDLRSYAAVCRDVVRRWAYPLVPESNFALCTSFAAPARNNVYREASARVGRGAVLEREVAVGAGSVVGDGAVVARSSIGRGCAVGAGATVRGCILWDGASVGAGATATDALLCKGAKVLDGAVVGRGCVLGPGVVVGRNVSLPAFTKLVASKTQPLDPGGSASEIDLGEGGVGFAWKDGDDVPYTNTLVPHDEREALAGDDLVCEECDDSSSSSSSSSSGTEDDDEDDEDYDGEAFAGFESEGSGDDAAETASPDEKRLELEVFDLVDTALQGYCPVPEFNLQLKALRMTYNAPRAHCGVLALRKLLNTALEGAASNNEAVVAVRKVLKQWSGLLAASVINESDMVELLEGVQAAAREPGSLLKPVFAFVVHALYDNDRITEDAIWAWVAKQKHADAPADAKEFLELCNAFLTWLETADEEEEDDDDDD